MSWFSYLVIGNDFPEEVVALHFPLAINCLMELRFSICLMESSFFYNFIAGLSCVSYLLSIGNTHDCVPYLAIGNKLPDGVVLLENLLLL